jgi:hypothetical protein
VAKAAIVASRVRTPVSFQLHLAFEAPNVRLAAPCQTAPCRKVMGVPGRSQAARKVK